VTPAAGSERGAVGGAALPSAGAGPAGELPVRGSRSWKLQRSGGRAGCDGRERSAARFYLPPSHPRFSACRFRFGVFASVSRLGFLSLLDKGVLLA